MSKDSNNNMNTPEHDQKIIISGQLDELDSATRMDPQECFSHEPPEWAKDGFNNDTASQCGYCGSWMTVVRPGKVQCDYCCDGQDIPTTESGE